MFSRDRVIGVAAVFPLFMGVLATAEETPVQRHTRQTRAYGEEVFAQQEAEERKEAERLAAKVQWHTFTGRKEKFSGKFIKKDPKSDQIVILKKDGEILRVRIRELRPEDQKFVRSEIARWGKAVPKKTSLPGLGKNGRV